jgi:hypothetical protein
MPGARSFFKRMESVFALESIVVRVFTNTPSLASEHEHTARPTAR